MINFYAISLFPEMVKAVLSESIIGRGEKRGSIKINYLQLRDFSQDKHKNVDDTVYGGGLGMLLTAAPIYNAWCEAINKIKLSFNENNVNTRTVYMSPKGKLLNQKIAENYAKCDNIIVICGHYEGVDERIIEQIVDEEISIGDYVLTGGELPCAIFIDCVARLCEGVLRDAECHEKESISSGLLEYPQYTKPFDFMGREVPEVLISGHHANIEKWRREQSLKTTVEKRFDLIQKNWDKLSKEDVEYLMKLKLIGNENENGNDLIDWRI